MAEDTTTRAGNGERVRLVSQERLDIPDTNALQSLVYSYVSRALGGILGPGSGIIVPPRTSWNASTSVLTFDTGFQAWDAWESNYPSFPGYSSSNRAYRGGLVEMDPAASGQSATIDLSGVTSAYGVVIWGKRTEFDGDLDTRRKWDTTTQDEIAFSTETRTKHRVAFAYTELTGAPQNVGVISAPAGWPDEHWFPILVSNVAASAWGDPAFRPVSAWDSFAEDHGEQIASQSSVTPSCVPVPNYMGIQKALISPSSSNALKSGQAGSFATYGGSENLIRMLWRMRNAIERIVGFKSDGSWFDAPGYDGRGIRQRTVTAVAPANDDSLDEGPATMDGDVLGSRYSLRNLADRFTYVGPDSYEYFASDGGLVPVAWGGYSYNSGTGDYELTVDQSHNLPAAATPAATGNVTITPTNTDGVTWLLAVPVLRTTANDALSIRTTGWNSQLSATVIMQDSSGIQVNDTFNIVFFGLRG